MLKSSYQCGAHHAPSISNPQYIMGGSEETKLRKQPTQEQDGAILIIHALLLAVLLYQ